MKANEYWDLRKRYILAALHLLSSHEVTMACVDEETAERMFDILENMVMQLNMTGLEKVSEIFKQPTTDYKDERKY